MRNIKGYFRGFDRQDNSNLSGDLFCIYINGDSASSEYTEVALAGNSPVVVVYNTSETPFDPSRNSTCTISIVADSYYEDVYPTGALDVPVTLKNETLDIIEWAGFLTPRVYDNDYSECTETIQLEAADKLSVLQYVDYTPCSADTRGIRPLELILEHIADAVNITDIYWMHEKIFSGSSENVLPSNIYLSEQNYFSSDTDEPWKMSEVLEEVCRYLGFTVIQYQDYFAFIDPLQLKTQNSYYCKKLYKTNGSWSYFGPEYLPGTTKVLSQSDIRGGSGSISFEPIYNKVTVKDNMYVAERLVPSIFEDNNLENRLSADSYYEEIEITPPTPYTPRYPFGCDFFASNRWKEDGSGDTKYTYKMRVYDNKYWTSVYDFTITDKSQFPKTQAEINSLTGATIVDLGVAKNQYVSEYHQKMVPSKMDYTRYLMINQKNNGYPDLETYSGTSSPVYTISAYTNTCPYIAEDTCIIISCNVKFEKYVGRPYINPDWDDNTPKFADSYGYKLQSGLITASLKMGSYYWNGSTWGNDFCVFPIPLEWDHEYSGTYNKDQKVLNNVSWQLGVGEDGYIVPIKRDPLSLRYPNLLDEITITFHLPQLQTFYTDSSHVSRPTLNGFCWIKDLDVKIVQKGQGVDRDSEADLIYENIINEDSIQEIREITCKHTTAFSGVSPSYSTVCYLSGTTVAPLEGIQDKNALEGRAPEENIIQKYVDEYSTPTKKITLTLDSQDNDITPFGRYKNVDLENTNQLFIELGREVDYQAGTATITFIELK